MTDTPRRNGARDDGTFTRDQRIQVMRWYFCDGMKAADAYRRLGCGPTSFYAWIRVTDEVEEAKRLGPTGDAPDVEAPPSSDEPFADLPPIGHEKPDNPSPEFMAVLANAYALHGDPSRLDRLAAWPSGTVQGWFDKAQRGDRACAIRVAQLERAAEVVTLQALVALSTSGNTVALRAFLTGRGVALDAAPTPKNGAEGHSLAAIEEEIVRRVLARRKGAG